MNAVSTLPSISIVGCGWVGFPVGRVLAAAGYRVRGSTTREARSTELTYAGITPFVMTLTPEPTPPVPTLFESEVLICTVPPGRSNASEADATTYSAQMEALMATAREHGVQRVIYTSSTGVYPPSNGSVQEDLVDPHHPDEAAAPTRPTAHAVRKAENIIVTAYPEAAVILRLGGLYGPNRHPGRFISGRTDVKRPHGPVNMVHQDDVVGVIQHILVQKIMQGVFNVVAPEHPTRQTFYEAAAADYGGTPPTFGPADGAAGKRVDPTQLIQKLGYTFQHSDPIASFQQDE